MYKSFDFEEKKIFDQSSIGQIWVLLAGSGQKIVCLAKLFFIRDDHIYFFIRFHQSTQKFLRAYTTGLEILNKTNEAPLNLRFWEKII